MARRKTTVNSVDLTRAIKAAKAGGLTICFTKIGTDGTITLVHVPDVAGSSSLPADNQLSDWIENRRLGRTA